LQDEWAGVGRGREQAGQADDVLVEPVGAGVYDQTAARLTWFVVFTCSYLHTWPRISGHAQSLPVVCGFLLLSTCLLAQEHPNFRIRAKNLCSLWFLLVHTCLLGQEFQDTREVYLWFVVFYF
jgi:hypothetical protein